MTYTREQIVQQLHKFYAKNGYLPGKSDLTPPPKGMPWYHTICKIFGSLDAALEATFGSDYAELKALSTKQKAKKHRAKMRKILKQEYWDKFLELGYPPTIDQVDADPTMHSKLAYFKYWGMRNLLKALDLEDSYHRPRSDGREYTEEFLLNALVQKYHRDNAIPTYRGVTTDCLTPSAKVYIRRFRCSWEQILRKAGLPVVRKNANRVGLTREELIDRLQQLAVLANRTPTSEEVDRSLITPCSTTYRKHFGSFYDALLASGLKPSPRQEAAHKGGLGFWKKRRH